MFSWTRWEKWSLNRLEVIKTLAFPQFSCEKYRSQEFCYSVLSTESHWRSAPDNHRNKFLTREDSKRLEVIILGAELQPPTLNGKCEKYTLRRSWLV